MAGFLGPPGRPERGPPWECRCGQRGPRGLRGLLCLLVLAACLWPRPRQEVLAPPVVKGEARPVTAPLERPAPLLAA